MYMKKYIALYMAPLTVLEQMMKNSKAEDREKGMVAWQAWNDAHEENVVEMGAPLGKTKTVTPDGVTDTKNEICGYTIVQADSLADAAEIFEDHPHLTMMQGSTIDVLECMDMKEM
jgi:hypothetical protein